MPLQTVLESTTEKASITVGKARCTFCDEIYVCIIVEAETWSGYDGTIVAICPGCMHTALDAEEGEPNVPSGL